MLEIEIPIVEKIAIVLANTPLLIKLQNCLLLLNILLLKYSSEKNGLCFIKCPFLE